MQKKIRQFTDNEKIIFEAGMREGEAVGYKNGLKDGENQLQQTITCIKAANKHLMDELLRLDYDKPILGDPRHVTIKIKITTLERFIKTMRKKPTQSQRYHYTKVFGKLAEKYKKQQRIITENIEKNLKETLEK